MLERGKQFLPREDPDAAQFLQDQMAKDGVQLLFDTKPQRFVLKSGDATKWSPETEIGVEVQSNGEKKMIDTNYIRAPTLPRVLLKRDFFTSLFYYYLIKEIFLI